jgi:uncharacterized protein
MAAVLLCAVIALNLALPVAAEHQGNPIDDLRAQCSNAMAPACEQLGRIYGRGEGVPRDPARAAHFFRLACDGGRQMGCVGLAAAHINGEGVARPSLVRAASLLEEACRVKVGGACETLALMYTIASAGAPGPGIPQELRKSATAIGALLWQGCEYGSVDACLGIVDDKGQRHAPDVLASLLRDAAASLAPGCARGEAQDCLDLGVLHAIGPRPDLAASDDAKRRGRRLLEAGCAAGRLGSDGCTGLGEMYVELRADSLDPAKAEMPLVKACEQKHLQACVGLRRLSGLYQRGEMVPKDQEKALQLARQACALAEPCDITALRRQRQLEAPKMDAPLVDSPPVRP